jgi:hypothetical protein
MVVPDGKPVTDGAYRAKNMVVPRNDEPALESHRLAAAVARGWWFHEAPPASLEDAWLNHALTWGMACMYVGATRGPDACDIRLAGAERTAREPLARREAAPLRVADGGDAFRREGLGPYVLFHLLRHRIGNEAFYAALSEILQTSPGEGVTTDRLRVQLERASGASLQGFFDYWVEGGLLPTVQLSWEELDAGVVKGRLDADVPFGEFDVVVEVTWTNGVRQQQWVRVVDGVGTFEAFGDHAVDQVALDPGGITLVRRGRVTRR